MAHNGVHGLMRQWGCGHGNMQVPRTLTLAGAGEVFVDVGLGTGAEETIAAARHGYHVFAFDPVAAHVQHAHARIPSATVVRLERHRGAWRATEPLAPSTRVHLFRAAVGDADGTVHVAAAGDLTTVSTAPGGDVPVVRLDSILPSWVRAVHLLKVDAQGFELRILRGALRWLRAHRVRYTLFELSPWLMERDGGDDPLELLGLLPGLGQVCFDMMGLHNLFPHAQRPLPAYLAGLRSGNRSYMRGNQLTATGAVPAAGIGPWEDVLCWDPLATPRANVLG